jgi:hypothetical protein
MSELEDEEESKNSIIFFYIYIYIYIYFIRGNTYTGYYDLCIKNSRNCW